MEFVESRWMMLQTRKSSKKRIGPLRTRITPRPLEHRKEAGREDLDYDLRYNPANPNEIRFNANDTIMFFSTPIVLGLAGPALTDEGLRWLWRSRRSKSKP